MKFPWSKREIVGTRDDVLAELKELANPNCTRCHGQGYLGYIEKKKELRNGRIVKPRSYIQCPKCIDKKL